MADNKNQTNTHPGTVGTQNTGTQGQAAQTHENRSQVQGGQNFPAQPDATQQNQGDRNRDNQDTNPDRQDNQGKNTNRQAKQGAD
jgi:hypothetical protein